MEETEIEMKKDPNGPMKESTVAANNDQEIRVFRAASRWCAAIRGTNLGSGLYDRGYGNDPVEAVQSLVRNKSIEKRIEELQGEFDTICEIVERTCPGPRIACETGCPFSRLGYKCIKLMIRDLLALKKRTDENRQNGADITERTTYDRPGNEDRIRGVR